MRKPTAAQQQNVLQAIKHLQQYAEDFGYETGRENTLAQRDRENQMNMARRQLVECLEDLGVLDTAS